MKLLKSYKTEINPTVEQKQIIHKTIGVCRYVYNFYLAYNKETYEKEKRFVTANEFSKWLNNTFVPNNQEYHWIKEEFNSLKYLIKSYKFCLTIIIQYVIIYLKEVI